MTTKERIVEEALTLFSIKGYKGTSVKNIADAVGIKDASLYNHFKSKQEIFQAIVGLVNEQIQNLSLDIGIPQKYNAQQEEIEAFSKQIDLGYFKLLAKKTLTYFLTDPYISKFWRITHMERYQNEEVYEMFKSIFMDRALDYQTKMFEQLINNNVFQSKDARAMAINFYAPIYMLISIYSNRTDKVNEALDMLEKQIEEFYRLYCMRK